MAEKLVQAMHEAAVPATMVLVEITEGALLENSQTVIENLRILAEHGIRISVDDFGTGYSSLVYLKRLPLTEVKVDKSFVDGLGHDPEDEAIASAVLSLARALQLQTVAEGVETREQLDWLIAHGCDAAQGYLLGRPLDVVAFEDLIAGTQHG